MRTIRCWQLRSALTAYVDHEISAGERVLVEDHLRHCDACRRRVRREEAVRQRLQRWSAEARAGGAPLSWRAAAEAPPPRRMGTVPRIAALSAATIAIAFAIWGRGWVDPSVPLAARGRIGDSRCARGHAHASAELRNLSDRDCVQRCVVMGAHYVFISQGVVYTIRNQDFGDLTRLAGQDVQLEGEVRQNLLTVVRVRPLAAGRSPDSSLLARSKGVMTIVGGRVMYDRAAETATR